MGSDVIPAEAGTYVTQQPSSLAVLSGAPGRRMPRWRIILCTVAMAGVQVCYAAQINHGTSELLLLGMSSRLVSLAWLAGPLSGLVMQPLVGRLSDRCTSRLGRRRPFLILGSILTSLSLLMFSNAELLAGVFVDGSKTKSVALSIAIVAFFLMDFSIQIVQAPLRALVTDVVPKKQRALANSYIGVFSGVGLLVGGLLTSISLRRILPVFRSDVQALFFVASAVLLIAVTVCVISTREEVVPRGASYAPLSSPEEEQAERYARQRRPPLEGLRRVPRPFWQVFTVQLCTWVGFFTLFVYRNAWVGRNIYLGDGNASMGSEERRVFEEGVRLGGRGHALMAAITLGYSLILPGLLRCFGVVNVYAFSQVVEAICLLVAPLIRGMEGQEYPGAGLQAATLIDIGMFGVVWATTMGVPWTLVGDALESDEWYARRVGLFQTVFNASQSFPQLVVGAAIAPVVLIIANDDPAYVMFAGGLFALCGAILVVVLRVNVFEATEKRGMRHLRNRDEDAWGFLSSDEEDENGDNAGGF
ncbi:unnamed protein product [Chondrus crispus]|uniref:Major facilitator superfamily (MFS) profile domain-containing protein n=1 Tax=Chondrus crispus TaxID=2769 RepID=R7QD15_CHOCR|nr:unnamed protein product [Chondrus crispus]CDF35954.1 unnamed protein product [Chondrus crispus]|eukprot:XP_005715773.1 unnamed protein product [Chondrus crispus]